VLDAIWISSVSSKNRLASIPLLGNCAIFFEAVDKERGPYTQAYEHLLQDTKKRLDKIQDLPDIIESMSRTSIASESANEELFLSWYQLTFTTDRLPAISAVA
jgi:hypothetical protein